MSRSEPLSGSQLPHHHLVRYGRAAPIRPVARITVRTIDTR
ncbi:hypothetical protein ACFW9O_29260 [Streptomyces sp. NPDC059499]